MHFFADVPTRELLASPTPTVLLYGGFEGFDNFGDILQLKGAIDFHRRYTGLQPVLVATMAAWTWPGLLEKLRADYDLAGVVFEDPEPLDGRELGLDVIREVQAGALLHIYGGGYFNAFWGARRAFVCEQLVFRLHLGDYVLTGLQVDEEGTAALAALFDKKPPLLVGARDERSRELLAGIVPADRIRFSFDDALEPVEQLRDDLVRFAAPGRERTSIGLHLNITAEYTSANQAALAEEVFARVHDARPDHGLTLLNAYNDRRRVVSDTFGSIGVVRVAERFVAFDAIDLATVAAKRMLSPADLRSLAAALAALDVVVASSYHVALTMNLLGYPTYLIASNDFYREKRKALGLEEDLERFLSDPRAALRDFAVERRRRLEWLDELSASIGALPGWREPALTLVPDEPTERTVLAKYAGS
jgi:hypothetical protein